MYDTQISFEALIGLLAGRVIFGQYLDDRQEISTKSYRPNIAPFLPERLASDHLRPILSQDYSGAILRYYL
jgi:hypothetical protein